MRMLRKILLGIVLVYFLVFAVFYLSGKILAISAGTPVYLKIGISVFIVYFVSGFLPRLFQKSIMVVPKNYNGLLYFLGRYTALVLSEGWHFVLPFLTEIRCYSIKTQKRDIHIEVESDEGDGTSLFVIVDGQFEFYFDPDLVEQYRLETDESITNGIVNAVKQELGIVAGKITGFDFIKNKEEITLMINCLLRLEKLPHFNAQRLDSTESNNCISVEDRLSFYKKHRVAIISLLVGEGDRRDERSLIEKRYGVNIRIFNLVDVSLSPETKKAFEAKRQEEAKMKGVQAITNKKLEIAKRWRTEIGLEPQAAANEADVSVGQADKNVWSFEGPIGEILKAILSARKGGG